MAVAQRIESLRHQHAALEAALHQEESHPWHNDSKIVRLKQNKLRIKDQLARLGVQDAGQKDMIRCRSDTG
jgi:hypothetical protein